MTHTGARVWQWTGIILILCLFGGAYWYFQVFAGVKVNSSLSDPLSEGLAGYWKFDEGTGTSAADSSTNANDLTFTGPTWTTGQIGGAISFNGTSDIIQKSSLGLFTNTFTVSLWAKMSSAVGNDYIFDYRAGTSLVAFRSSAANDIFVRDASSNTPGGGQVSPGFLYDNTWHMYTITGDGANVRAFRDGVQQGSARTWTNSLSTGSVLTWGRDNGGEYFGGSVDETRIYNRALSAEEVAQLYHVNSPTGVDTNLKGYWTFDGADTTSTTATDRSGAGNTGTLSGVAVTRGKLGQALSFSGSGSQMAISMTQTGKTYTFSTWANLSSGSGYFFDTNGGRLTLSFGQNAPLARSLSFYDGSWKSIGSINSIPLNEWVYLVWVFDNSNSTAYGYINGVLQGTAAYTGKDISTLIKIGNHYSAGDTPISGSLDEVRVYNTALTAAQIQSLYKRGESDTMNVMDTSGNLNSGLAGYWKLDEGSGTSTVDSSINGSTGTLTNGPTWTTGQIGSAVDFDGTDDYIDMGTPAALDVGAGAHSVSAWVKTDVTNTDQTIFTSGSASCCGVEVSLAIDYNSGGGYYEFGFAHQGAGTQNSTIAGDIQTGTWYFVTGTWDGSTRSVYVNGVLHSTAAVTGLAAEYNNNARIGRGENSTASFDGQIDEVRVYSRAISATEVAQLYRYTGPAAADSGLVGYWSFNGTDTTSTKAYDRSGSGNTGTLTNGPTVIPGKIGQALSFDGTNDYVSTGTWSIGSTFTMSSWVKFDSVAAGYKFIMSKDSALDSYAFGTKNSYFYYAIHDSAWAEYVTTVIPVVNRWYHVVWTRDASNNLVLYLDGVQQQSFSSVKVPATNAGMVLVGSHVDTTGSHFPGSIDEVRVYNRALSASEIQAQYKAGQSDEVNTGASQAQGTGRLDSGLAGYWKLDEGSGTTVTDSSTNGISGTFTLPTWTTGQIGGALNFGAVSNGYVALTDSPVFDVGGAGSWCHWFNADTGQTGKGMFQHEGSGTYKWMTYITSSSSAIGMYVRVGGNTYGAFGPSGTYSGTWRHLCGTFDKNLASARLKLYLDGVLVGSDNAASGDIESGDTPRMGTWFSGGGEYGGKLDEVRIYNRALSADEVAQLYRLNAPTGTDTSLKGYWSFNGKDMNGTTAYDRSGAGNTGTLTNGPTVTPGKLGQALNFDGVNDNVNMGNVTSLKNSVFTYSAWINPTSLSAERNIFGGGAASTPRFSITTGGILTFLKTGVATIGVSTGTAPTVGVWTHVAVTYDVSGNYVFYINGVNAGSGTNAQTFDFTSASFGIGSDSGNMFVGKIDEVRVYNRALSAAEITSLYNASR